MNWPRRTLLIIIAGLIVAMGWNVSSQTNPPATELNCWQTTRTNPAFFPIAVWMQAPTNAAAYRAAGINLFVGLWDGPTDAQLTELQRAGMLVVCPLNDLALKHSARSNIFAWMHGDEPDNAQTRGARLGLASPIPPDSIVADYRRMKSNDATRPVFLNLGQGVAWDNWYGRGTRNNHPEDYPLYLQGCDIASFDIYPTTHPNSEVRGNLWYVPRGVERLRAWVKDEKPVWNCIETTHGDDPKRKPTPHEVRTQVWMSLIHGSRGIIYFAHQFEPTFVEAALLADKEMLAAVKQLNEQISSLAPVLNSPSITNAITVQSENPAAPIATMVKRSGGFTYIFAVAMRPLETQATCSLKQIPGVNRVEVLGENRSIPPIADKFTDSFGPWQVHLYRIAND
jgi:hypothetical protein